MKRKISIVGVPMSYGQVHPGVELGPNAIRFAGIIEKLQKLGYEVEDTGNIKIETRERTIDGKTGIKNLDTVVGINEHLASQVDTLVQSGSFPLILGGDHSIAIGTLAGLAKHYKNLGVIWYDAHGDLNTAETSPSGNIHGMPLAASLGLGVEALTNLYGYAPKIKYENIVIIGARALDEGEKILIKEKGIKIYTMHDIDRFGIKQVIEDTIQYLKERTDGVHLSFDLDSLDPYYSPGVGTPVDGGLSHRESCFAMELLAESRLITSCEFVEVNPLLDVKNKTAILAVDLMASLFGETLL